MSRINVLWAIDHVCYDGDLHGGGRLYWNLLPKFDTERFNVVPVMLRASDEIRELFRDSPVPVRILDKGKHDPTTLWTFLRLIRKENIHVMHLHCYGASIFGRLAGLMTGVPCILHDYDTAIYFPYPPYLWAADKMLSSMTRRAVAASPMVQDYFVNRRQIDAEKVTLAFHAIPSERFVLPTRDSVDHAREVLGVPEGARVIGTTTKLGPQRGNLYLLRAAARVLRAMQDAVFVVLYSPTVFHRRPDQSYVDTSSAESESSIEELEREAAALGIKDSVRFVRADGDTGRLMAAFDVFVAPFLHQRFSSVQLLEAMAIGKPVVATGLGEQSEIIAHGINGNLVPPGDEDALAEGIVDIFSDKSRLASMRRQARATAEGYSVDGYARTLEGWYEELAASPKQDAVHVGGSSR